MAGSPDGIIPVDIQNMARVFELGLSYLAHRISGGAAAAGSDDVDASKAANDIGISNVRPDHVEDPDSDGGGMVVKRPGYHMLDAPPELGSGGLGRLVPAPNTHDYNLGVHDLFDDGGPDPTGGGANAASSSRELPPALALQAGGLQTQASLPSLDKVWSAAVAAAGAGGAGGLANQQIQASSQALDKGWSAAAATGGGAGGLASEPRASASSAHADAPRGTSPPPTHFKGPITSVEDIVWIERVPPPPVPKVVLSSCKQWYASAIGAALSQTACPFQCACAAGAYEVELAEAPELEPAEGDAELPFL